MISSPDPTQVSTLVQECMKGESYAKLHKQP